VSWYRISLRVVSLVQAGPEYGRSSIINVASKSLEGRQPAAEIWRQSLAKIPTVFGRLAYLASLRNPETHRYIHSSLTAALGTDDADRALCNTHHQVFSQWIGFSLSEQKADLDEYLRTSGGRKDLMQQYRNLPPAAARDVERQLYLTDLEMLMELLRYAGGDDFAAPGA